MTKLKALLSDSGGAQSGAIIYVAAGTYQPEQGQSFFLPSGVKLYGGYDPDSSGTETSNNRNIKTHTTTLKGNGSTVIKTKDADGDTLLDGFTVTGGSGTASNNDRLGGGMYNNGGKPKITNCTFSGNEAVGATSAGGYGGGMYNNNSSPTVTNCTFSNNRAAATDGATGAVTGNSGNSGTGGTDGTGYGGGMYNYQGSNPTETNCTFSGNTATRGGGMDNSDSSPTVTNCIFWGNTLTGSGSANEISGGTATNFTYCVIKDGDSTYNVAGTNNVFEDPKLASLANNGGPTQTIAIMDGSSAIGTGTPVDGITTDQRGKVRNNPPCIGAFEQDYYTITATAGTNGAISPSGSVSVWKNQDQTFTFTPDTYYEVDQVKVNGVATSVTNNPYTFENVTANHTINVTFKPKTFTITKGAMQNGDITVANTIKFGETKEFTVTPNEGYSIERVTASSGNVTLKAGTTDTYTLSNVTADVTITATFTQNKYSVRLICGGGGSIKSKDSSPITYGGSPGYTISADEGYVIDFVKIDDVAQPDAVGRETFDCTVSNVVDNSRSLTANFRLKQYTITASADAHGRIDPSGDVTVDHGASRTFSITADSGYETSEVKVNGEAKADAVGKSSYSCTVTNVTASGDISASFRQKAAAPQPGGSGVEITLTPGEVPEQEVTQPETPTTPGTPIKPNEEGSLVDTPVPGSEGATEVADDGGLSAIGVTPQISGGMVVLNGEPRLK